MSIHGVLARATATDLEESDLDATAARLTAAGVSHEGVVDVSASRALMLTDPDGNRVVLTGP